MPEESAEVKVKLAADEAATKVVDDLKKSLDEASKSAENTNKALSEAGKKGSSSFQDILKGNLLAQKATEALGGSAAALAGPYGVALEGVDLLKEGLEGAWEMTKKLAEASAEAADEDMRAAQQTAGQLSLFDAGAHKLLEVREYAEGVHDELEDMGIKAGVTAGQMDQMYDAIIARGGIASEKAKDLAGDMALVGRMVSGGSGSIAQGFSMMELGIVQARNPLVQLISSTQTLRGNAHAVAEQMMKMAPDKQMELAEKAIAKQADLMKQGGGLSAFENLGTLKTSLEGEREAILKSIGDPLIKELIPMLTDVKNTIADNLETIEDVGTRVGTELADLTADARAALGGMYDSIKQNWAQLEEVFHATFDEWYDAWNFGDMTTDQIHDKFKEMTDDMVKGFKDAMTWAKAIGEVFMDIGDIMSGKKAGSTQASVAAREMETKVKAGYSATGKGDTAAFEEAARRYRAKAIDAGQSEKAVDAYIASQRKIFDSTEQLVDSYRQVAQHADPESMEKLSAYAEQNMLHGDQITRDGTTKFMADLLNNSEDLRKALLDGSLHISSGMEEFIKMLTHASPELARKLKEMSNTIKHEGGIKGLGPQINFNNNTFNIKQDFKDDPDRVMIAFRQDILRSAVSRRQSRLGTVFGL